ncbi:hypothetical protein OS493_035437 [Desmophyllum pertusum]|uniref:Endothelin-converting enzyme 1 n=1 Tax=Desmophyllum pertusum TaxID=174260 RepID=A0A9X0D0M6_9CNID|nr:hypothetical protein OS493_035437 [Desmophyllum pertusum]
MGIQKLTEYTDDEPDYGGVKYKLRHFTKFRLLCIITAIFLVLSIIFIILYAVEKSKVDDTTSSKPGSKNCGQVYCGTSACLHASLDALKQLNQSADPCTDFYEYACGGWENENALEAGKTSVTGFSLVREKSYNVLKEALANASKNYSANEAVMKTVKFYNVCLDAVAVEARGDGPLRKLIDDMGGWNVTGNMKSLSSMDISQRIGKVSSELFSKPFIDVRVSIDPHNSNKHILQFVAGELGMRRSYYTKNTSDDQTVREAYKTYMKTIAKYLGGGSDSDEQMMKVFEFESKLAMLDKDDEESSIIETLKKELQPGVATYDLRTTLEAFSVASKMDLNKLVALVNAVFARQNRTFKKDEKVLAYPPKYYARLFSFYDNMTKTDPVVFVNYIMWTVITKFVKLMPKKMQPVFGMPLGLLFVDAAFDEGSKETITQMTRLIKEEFINGLETLSWMSPLTRANAREKANGISQDIGYPSYIKNPSKLAAKIKGLKVGDTIFENVVNSYMFGADESYGSLDKPVDRDQWFMGPSQVNGYYSPRQNRIVFLAAILQPPFYNPNYPKYFNYGGIGMVIGHEVTHGFDNSGRIFDKDGNVNNWWSALSFRGFSSRTDCLSRQYSEFDVYGQKINGNQTLNENIADNGGIKLAFNAYKKLVEKEGTEGALPGLGLTEEQLFFVGFAQPWCSIYKKKAALLQLATDSHTFPQYRIIGTLRNYDKFAEAFKCKQGSGMNPEKKCTLW